MAGPYSKISALCGAGENTQPIKWDISKFKRETLHVGKPWSPVGDISWFEWSPKDDPHLKAVFVLFVENISREKFAGIFSEGISKLISLFNKTREEEMVFTFCLKVKENNKEIDKEMKIPVKFDPRSASGKFMVNVGETGDGSPIVLMSRLFCIAMPAEADPYVEIRKFIPLMAHTNILAPVEIEEFNKNVIPNPAFSDVSRNDDAPPKFPSSVEQPSA